MGDARTDALRIECYSRRKLEFHGAAVTNDAGLIAYRELDEGPGHRTVSVASWPIANGTKASYLPGSASL